MASTHDAHGHADHGHHHHEESFVSKYIFSQDHKMIGKQFLITAVFMGLVAMLLSILFRIQLAWPGESSDFLYFFLGDQWAPEGVLKEDMYLGLVTIHGTIMVFFLLTGGLSGTFSNLLIPLQLGARDMASGFLEHVVFLVFLCLLLNHVLVIICVQRIYFWFRYSRRLGNHRKRSCNGRVDGISAVVCPSSVCNGFWIWYDVVVNFYGHLYRRFFIG